jgi:hypothetical protein
MNRPDDCPPEWVKPTKGDWFTLALIGIGVPVMVYLVMGRL